MTVCLFNKIICYSHWIRKTRWRLWKVTWVISQSGAGIIDGHSVYQLLWSVCSSNVEYFKSHTCWSLSSCSQPMATSESNFVCLRKSLTKTVAFTTIGLKVLSCFQVSSSSWSQSRRKPIATYFKWNTSIDTYIADRLVHLVLFVQCEQRAFRERVGTYVKNDVWIAVEKFSILLFFPGNNFEFLQKNNG